jgi:hypothetical protein
LVAGLALMVFLALAFFPFVDNYNLFFLSFYLVGLIGSFIGIFNTIKKIISSPDRKAALGVWVKRDSFIALIILSIFFSLLYSIIWPSGKLEFYFSYNYDYFSWIFATEYLTGGINTKTLDLNPFFFYIINDAFGTYTILGAIATANLKTPFLASPILGLTLLVWTAEALYCLLRTTFGLKSWLTVVLTLGVASGSLFNYVAIIGMFGHMIFLITFLICLEQLSLNYNFNIQNTSLKRRLFFPFFLLFISYQAVYIILISFIAFFMALLIFLQRQNQRLLFRLAYSTIIGFWTVALITIVCTLLAPGIFFHLSQRVLEVAAQTAGWGLPFFSPWHFSGLPYYSQNAFQPIVAQVFWRDILAYIPLYIITLAFLLFIWYKNINKIYEHNYLTNKSLSKFYTIASITITYLVALGTFIVLCLKFDTSYKTWKFATYVVLPLSFVPTALLFKVLENLSHKITPTIVIIVFLITFIGYNFYNMPSLIEIPAKYLSMTSATPKINAIQNIQSKLPKSSTIFIDFNFYHESSILPFIFNSSKFSKIIFLNSFPYFQFNNIDFDIINKNTFILSDTNDYNIIKSVPNAIESRVSAVYDYNSILNKGLVFFSHGPFPYHWEVDLYPVHASFLIPLAQRGKELKLSINISAPTAPTCRKKARLGIYHKDGIIWEEKDIDQLWMQIPADLSITGSFYTHLILPQPSNNKNICLYKINSFVLE